MNSFKFLSQLLNEDFCSLESHMILLLEEKGGKVNKLK